MTSTPAVNRPTPRQIAREAKRAWVVALLEQGASYRRIASMTGCSKGLVETVARELRDGEEPASRELVEEFRALMPVKLAQAIDAGLSSIADATPSDWQDLKLDRRAVTTAVMIDKLQLLQDRPTTINRTVHEGATDAELVELAQHCIEELRSLGVAPAIDVTPGTENEG
jgi:hypothetical protein